MSFPPPAKKKKKKGITKKRKKERKKTKKERAIMVSVMAMDALARKSGCILGEIVSCKNTERLINVSSH